MTNDIVPSKIDDNQNDFNFEIDNSHILMGILS